MSEINTGDVTPDSGSADAGQGEDGFVQVHEASDDELKDFWKTFNNQNPTEENANTGTKKPAEEKPPTEEDETSEDEPITLKKSDLEKFKRELEEKNTKVEKLERQQQKDQEFINRRNTEIGQLRKQLAEALAEGQSNLESKFYENPKEALELAESLKEVKGAMASLDKEEAVLRHVQETHELIAASIDPSSIDPDALVAVLKADGLDDGQIKQFMEQPYLSVRHGETLVQLLRRADAHKRLAKTETTLNQLVAYTEKLLEENAKLKAKPGNFLNKVNEALKVSPPMATKSLPKKGFSATEDVDVTSLSDADLAELRKSLQRR